MEEDITIVGEYEFPCNISPLTTYFASSSLLGAKWPSTWVVKTAYSGYELKVNNTKDKSRFYTWIATL